jgi:hypothetical protein
MESVRARIHKPLTNLPTPILDVRPSAEATHSAAVRCGTLSSPQLTGSNLSLLKFMEKR